MPLLIALTLLSIALALQGATQVYLMLYGWNRRTATSDHRQASSVPCAAPCYGFSILLPAWHESEVIGHTIDRIAAIDYPSELFEVLVICDRTDTRTIEAAALALSRHPGLDSDIVLLTDGPVSKAHGLNNGLRRSKHEIVGVIDAEDDVHPAIVRAANSAFDSLAIDIVQGPVQLVNNGSRWFSQLNCLEYYFWFQSRMLFHAHNNVTPLAGNTVFFRRSVLDALAGWDEHCLAEDADVGIRASALGFKTAILADAELATREETPEDLAALLRQRVRWHQGFLQVLRKGDWLKLPSLRQRGIALVTLSFPLYAALTSIIWPLSIPALIFLKGPVGLSLVAAVPFYALLAQMLVSTSGLFALRRQFGITLGPKQLVLFVVGFMPYQWMLGLCGIRAVVREIRGMGTWEKTPHTGSHRIPAMRTGVSQAASPATNTPVTAVVDEGLIGSVESSSRDIAAT